jgi:thioredoxin reductase
MKSPHALARDPASVAGKAPPITEEADVLIIGAGVSGVAAALKAATAGVRVMLIDENPLDIKSMGEEIPLHFGGRMNASLQNRNAALERVLEANPGLGEAFEAGIDVRLGTACFGLFPKHSSAAWMQVPVAGLVDAEHAYLVRFKQAIVAAGARDMGLAFEGWELPGVMGAHAAYRLKILYGALDAERAVLVGSDNHALQIAGMLAERGVHIEAIVEQSGGVRGSRAMLERLTCGGARFYPGHVIARAEGDHAGVSRLLLVRIDEAGKHQPGETVELRCDSVLLGVASIPAIELLEAAGCTVRHAAARGGYVPCLDASQGTSVQGLYAVGDCAGTWDEKSSAVEIAAREGRIAANAAVAALGLAVVSQDEPVITPNAAADVTASRLAWVRASVLNSPAGPIVCQCEGVNAAAILGLEPPAYVPRPGFRPGVVSEFKHAAVGPTPDLVKRLTRAGMGPCQGRRCREQVGALVALGLGREPCSVPHGTYRTPVRPLPLSQLASLPESPAMNDHWDSWFGMPSQWIPFWRVSPSYSVANRGEDEAARE